MFSKVPSFNKISWPSAFFQLVAFVVLYSLGQSICLLLVLDSETLQVLKVFESDFLTQGTLPLWVQLKEFLLVSVIQMWKMRLNTLGLLTAWLGTCSNVAAKFLVDVSIKSARHLPQEPLAIPLFSLQHPVVPTLIWVWCVDWSSLGLITGCDCPHRPHC